MASKLLTGDQVLVIRGRDKGVIGRIRRNIHKDGKVIVDGANVVRRHVPRQQGVAQGGIIESEAPFDRSNVMLICPSCDQPVRVGFRMNDSGVKERYCRICDAAIPRPDVD